MLQHIDTNKCRLIHGFEYSEIIQSLYLDSKHGTFPFGYLH